MQPFIVSIPSHVYEAQLLPLLNLLDQADGHAEVVIDIAAVRFLTPAAIVAILARRHRWKREGKGVSLAGAEACESLGYLQRIDFVAQLGIEIPESFTRHPAADRFVPVRSLSFASGDVNRTASEITRCALPNTAPDDDVYRLLQYAAGELLSNAKYHSGGRAFVCAQYFQKRNLVRIAVADDGIGIRASFDATTREADAATPDAAIRLALLPGVSCARLRPNPNPYAGQNHRGVGLSITRILAKESYGQLTIASDGGWFDELQGEEQPAPRKIAHFPGTLVAVTLPRGQIADYAAMHAKAMSEIGMGGSDAGGMFFD